MIKNYFKVAWRALAKRKFYALINIAGLGLAVCCCTLIYFYISYQLSFDTYHKRAGHIFRVVYELHLEKTEYDKGGSYAIYITLKTQAPQVGLAAMSVSNQTFTITINGNTQKRFLEEKNITFADESWFKLFSYHWLQGSPAQLNEPNTAALSQSQSRKYFGEVNPIGKIIDVDDKPVKVIGLIADGPYNTDMRSDIYLSFSSIGNLVPKIENGFFSDWGYLNSSNNIFVSVKSIDQQRQVENQLASETKKRFGLEGAKHFTFKLLPLKAIHFDTRYGAAFQKTLLTTLEAIGMLILIVACINYINLTIAQQTRRSIEIGTRKVLGGSAKQLFMLFMTESVLNTLLAITIGTLSAIVLLPLANRFLFAENPVYIISYQNLLMFTGILFAAVTLGTGIYPALVLSRINIFRALKNDLGGVSLGISRKALIVFQNVVAQALIACTIIIAMQVAFLRNTDKGFDRKSVVMVPVNDATDIQREQFGQAMRAIPGVQSSSLCRKPPSSDSQLGATVLFDNRAKWETWPARFVIGDSAYRTTFALRIIAGRDIRNKQPKPEFLVNETMANMLHVSDINDVIGKDLTAGDVKGVIVGVVKDFAVRSLTEPIEPSVLLEDKYWQNTFAVKLSGQKAVATLTSLQKAYQAVFPNKVFTYSFVDDQIAALYKTEILQQKLIWSASVIAIIISLLGLLGLISLMILHRTKEIGIRKVLGATATQISLLLSSDFLGMVFIAVILATPAALWAMHKWLQNFAYRIEIQWWVFALTALFSFLLAFITVSAQSVKAAQANPVKSLRSE